MDRRALLIGSAASAATLAWGRKVSPQFARKVIALAEALRIDPSWLMACIAFESSETFSSSVINRQSGATGLIQFMPKTARQMGTTVEALALLSPEEQLEYVARYFQNYAGKLKSLDDVYMVILWPRAVGKPAGYLLFDAKNKKSKAYVQNRGLDLNKDGTVTKAEAASKIREKLKRGMRPQFCLTLDAEPEPAPATAEVGEPAAEEAILLPSPTRSRPADEAPAPTPIEDAVASAAVENVRRAGEPTDYTIEYVQRRLRQLNYFTVGRVDGDYGSLMAGAIVRFKRDKLLQPEDSSITPAFLALLRDPDCAPAPISDKRANATVEDLAPQNTTLWALAWQKVVALATMIGTAFMAALNWLYEKIGSDYGIVDRLGGVVAKMPVWGWLGIASGICLLGFALVKRGEHDQVEKYRRGELL